MHDKIVMEQSKSAVRKYISSCESLNIDCVLNESFLAVAFLFSRYSIDVQRSWSMISKFFTSTPDHDFIEMHTDDDVNNLALQFSNGDWKHLFENVEISSEISENAVYNHPILQTLLTCMKECFIPFPGSSQNNVLIKFFLNMCPTGTPAAKMCENFLTSELQKLSQYVPYDLELKIMKCLSMFHDQKIDTEKMQSTHLYVLQLLHVSNNLQEAVRYALNERAENLQLFNDNRHRFSKPRLSEYVKRSQKLSLSYDSSFKHWTAVQKFGINTSLRMQKILYFMRVQCEPIAKELYLKYFSEKLADIVMSSTVDTIDAEPIMSCIQTIRTYKHRVEPIISFRTECLSALPLSIRTNLKPATALQLYISAYQHESVRTVCLENILQAKISYNLSKNLSEFIKRNAFQIEPVLDSLVDALYALAAPKNITAP